MSTATAAIYRGEVPVDDRWHIIDAPGPIVSWGCRRPDAVEFWFWHGRPGDVPRQHVLRVFGTGHPISGAEHTQHLATLLVPETPLVWQVLEWQGRPGSAWPPAAGAMEGVLRMEAASWIPAGQPGHLHNGYCILTGCAQ